MFIEPPNSKYTVRKAIALLVVYGLFMLGLGLA